MRGLGERPAIAGGQPVRPRERFLVFGAPAIAEEEIAGVVDCLRRRWIGTGPKVQQFEQAFAEFKRAPNAIAVSSGTAAIHLSLVAFGLGPGDEVITTPMSFCSTVNAIIHAGATPVLADCDPRTFNILPQEIERRITARTRAILVVHMCGRCCDMDPIMTIARRRGLLVIEDCAHAVESVYKGTPAGMIGDIGCFSFYATKNLTTGEGGMVTTADAEIAARIKTLALHGLSADAWTRFSDSGYLHYEVDRPGFKCNLTDISAAIGLAQLEKLAGHTRRREEIWQQYSEELVDLPCLLPPAPEDDTTHAFHLYTPLLELERISITRDRVLEALTAEHVGAGVHFVPIHEHRYYRANRMWSVGDFPNAEFIGQRTLSLPLAGDLEPEDVADVCRALGRILTYYGR